MRFINTLPARPFLLSAVDVAIVASSRQAKPIYPGHVALPSPVQTSLEAGRPARFMSQVCLHGSANPLASNLPEVASDAELESLLKILARTGAVEMSNEGETAAADGVQDRNGCQLALPST